MKKFLTIGVMVTCGFISATTSAFDINNTLVNKLYDKVDAIYAANPERVLKAYHKLPLITMRASANPELAYYLDKLATYIHGKLFVFNEQPNFVCFDNYAQQGDTAEINYTIKDSQGTLLATTLTSVATEYGIEKENTLAFNLGSEHVMEAINENTYGVQIGKAAHESVEARDAWGNYDTNKRITFTSDIPASIANANIGEKVMIHTTVDDVETALFGIVTEKNQTAVTVDFNHPHAGKDIALSVYLLKLFKACK